MQKKHGRVAIISRESNEKTLDIAMLEEELLRRGLEVTVLCRLLTKEKSFKALGYIGHVLKQEAAILRSDVVVLDTYCIPASMLPHRRSTKIVQMWHALSAIKKFGWQTVGKEEGSSEKVAKLMRMHRGYNYVVSASDITAEHFCEAFDVPRSSIAKYGLPRIDYIKSVSGGAHRAGMAEKIYKRYPQLCGRGCDRGRFSVTKKGCDREPSPVTNMSAAIPKIILYAPTFRRGKAVDVQSLIDVLDLEKFQLVVKLHPLYRGSRQGNDSAEAQTVLSARESDKNGSERGNALQSAGSVIYDDEFPSCDWLSVADLIISDYSSFVVESTLADKPLFIYAYDIDEYAERTGLNMDFDTEPIAPYVFRDAKSLAAAVNAACDEGDSRCAGSEETGSSSGRAGSAPDEGVDIPAGTELRKAAGAPSMAGYDMDALRAFRDRYIDIPTGTAGDGNSRGAAGDGVSTGDASDRESMGTAGTGKGAGDRTGAGTNTVNTAEPADENFCTRQLADFIEEISYR